MQCVLTAHPHRLEETTLWNGISSLSPPTHGEWSGHMYYSTPLTPEENALTFQGRGALVGVDKFHTIVIPTNIGNSSCLDSIFPHRKCYPSSRSVAPLNHNQLLFSLGYMLASVLGDKNRLVISFMGEASSCKQGLTVIASVMYQS